MKHFIIFLIVVVLISCTTPWNSLQPVLPDLRVKPDGVYRGHYSVSGTPIEATLDVSVQSNTVNNITIIEHLCSPIGKKAEKIIDRIIKNQSLNVDVISGATVSSKAILMAVENALQ